MKAILPVLVLGLCACNSQSNVPSGNPSNADEGALYTLGYSMGSGMRNYNIQPNEIGWVERGIVDAALQKQPAVPLGQYMGALRERVQRLRAPQVAQSKAESKIVLDKAKAEQGAQVLPSGMVFLPLEPGKGPSPKATDRVKVEYKGTLPNGQVFDASDRHGGSAEFELDKVIPCWTQGVQLMKVGEKAKLTCPSDLAYRDSGVPPLIPGGAALTFEVKLLAINPPAPPTH